MKYWEIIADNLSKAGWSWGCVSAIDSNGRTIWIADAHRDDGKRFVLRADEKLTAFLELESAIRAWRRIGLTSWQETPLRRRRVRLRSNRPITRNRASLTGSESGGGLCPATFFVSFRTRHRKTHTAGKEKGRTMNSLIQLKKTTPLLLIAFVLACLALSPRAQAAPNNNTSYGKGA